MAEHSIDDVEAILADQGIAEIPADELVETVRRLNALIAGLDRLEGSGTFGDLELWPPFDPGHGTE